MNLTPKTGILFVLNTGEEGLGNLKGVRQVMEDYKGRVSRLFAIDGNYRKVVNDARWVPNGTALNSKRRAATPTGILATATPSIT